MTGRVIKWMESNGLNYNNPESIKKVMEKAKKNEKKYPGFRTFIESPWGSHAEDSQFKEYSSFDQYYKDKETYTEKRILEYDQLTTLEEYKDFDKLVRRDLEEFGDLVNKKEIFKKSLKIGMKLGKERFRKERLEGRLKTWINSDLLTKLRSLIPASRNPESKIRSLIQFGDETLWDDFQIRQELERIEDILTGLGYPGFFDLPISQKREIYKLIDRSGVAIGLK